jgi:hypothetical protein
MTCKKKVLGRASKREIVEKLRMEYPPPIKSQLFLDTVSKSVYYNKPKARNIERLGMRIIAGLNKDFIF